MTSRMRRQRTNRRAWLWRLVRIFPLAFAAALFTIYWPATVRDIYSYEDGAVSSVALESAPTYLDALVGEATHGSRRTPIFHDLDWASIVPEFGLDVTTFTYGRSDGDWDPDTETTPPWIQLDRYRVGWPLKAGYWDDHSIPPKGNRAQIDAVFRGIHDRAGLRIGIERPSWAPGDKYRRIPVTLLATGLFGNIAFFMLVCLSPGALWRGLRSHRRRKRGQCLDCGYMIEGSRLCPECGTEA